MNGLPRDTVEVAEYIFILLMGLTFMLLNQWVASVAMNFAYRWYRFRANETFVRVVYMLGGIFLFIGGLRGLISKLR